MSLLGLAQRNLREVLRDKATLVVLLAMPAVLILFFGQVLRAGAEQMTPPGGEPPEFLSLEHATVGMGVFGLLWLMTMAAGKIADDKQTGFLRRLRTTPTRAPAFVLAYSLAPALVAVLQIAVILAAAVVLGLRWEGNTYLLGVVFFLCALSTIGVGMLLASFTSNREQIEGVTILILLPLAFFSGVFMPREMLPAWAGAVGSRAYTGRAVDVGQQILTGGADLTSIVPQLRALGVWAGALLLLGMLGFRWNIRAER